jgi:hypothetical protein
MAGILQGCLLVGLSIGTWTGQRFDKKNTNKIIADTNAHEDALRVNKHLISKEALIPIGSSVNAIRSHFYKETLPWKDNGDRLITRPAYMDFIPRHQELVRAFNEQVDEFINEGYPRAMEIAEFRMGKAYEPQDYPHPNRLRAQFHITLDVTKVPDEMDFRLASDPTKLQARINGAIQGLWDRLRENLEAIVSGVENGKLKTATLNNMRILLGTIPKLNFTNDEQLAGIAKQIEDRIACFDTDDLIGRKCQENRDAVQEEAAAILKSMEGFLRATSGQQEAA